MLGVKIAAYASKFPYNTRQNSSSRLLDHFIVIKFQCQSLSTFTKSLSFKIRTGEFDV